MPSRHGPSSGGTKRPPTARLACPRAVYTVPFRSNTCGSAAAKTAAITSGSSGESVSTSRIRPGCSVCADRPSPHTAAPAKSVTSSPGNAIAPRVDTTSVPAPSRANHDCSTGRTARVAAYTSVTMSPATGADSNSTAEPSELSDPSNSPAPQAHTDTGCAAEDDRADQTTSKRRSGPEFDPAPSSC